MQVPVHECRVVEDAGSEKVAIDIHLTGVTDASSINVVIEPPHIVTVLVPDRYHLQLTLSVPISAHADSVRFKRRTGKLAMLCTVLSTTEGSAETAPPPAAAGHEQLQEVSTATAAEPAQPAAADSAKEQECADAVKSVTGRRQQQQQHADQAAVAKPGRQVKSSGQSHKAKAAQAAEIRRGTNAAVQEDAQQKADKFFKATKPNSRLKPSPLDELAADLAALQQQQQGVTRAGGSQQQAVKVDLELPKGFAIIEEQLRRRHELTLVGYWCAAFDALMIAVLRLGMSLVYWTISAREAKRMPLGPYGDAALHVITWLGIGLVVLSAIPTVLWQRAWQMPLSWLAAIRVVLMPGVRDRHMQAAIKIERQALRNKLQDNDSLRAGLMKVLLAAITAAALYSMCVWQFGSHSLGGWVLAALLLAWRVVVWLWRLLLWRPPSWYPLQLLAGGIYSVLCFGPDSTSRERTQDCSSALGPLQVIITGGGWTMLYSFALSVLWHMGACWDWNCRGKDEDTDATAQQPAGKAAAKKGTADKRYLWWQAAAAGMFPTVTRSWLVLLSHWGPSQAALSAVGAGVEAAVVLLAGGLGSTLSLMQDGLQLMSAACRNSLANVPPGPLKILAGSLLGALAARGTGLASRLGWWWVQRAAWVVMGVLTWAAPAWYVGPLVPQACAASGVWQEGCLELLQPYAAQAPDSLSLSHSWWFTLIVQVWVGCIFRQLVACRGGEAGGMWLQEERQQRLEAARQRKEQKVQQRRQQKRHGH